MPRPIIVLALLLTAGNAIAQKWDVSIGAGLPYTRVFRTDASTKATSYLQFGYVGPGSYLNPEVGIWLTEQGRFSFDILVSNNRVGVNLGGNTREENYDFFSLYTFCVGYAHQFTGLKGRAKFGVMGKAGIAYGYNTGGGYSSSGGSNRQQSAYVQLQPMYDAAAVMPPFWMPVVAAGVTAGPVIETIPAVSDRIDLSLTAVLGLGDMYADYAKVKYTIATPTTYEDGVAQYRGRPFTLQVGIRYRLFRIIRDR